MWDGVEEAREILLLQVQIHVGGYLGELVLNVLYDVLNGPVELVVTENGSAKFIDDCTNDLAQFGIPTEHIADDGSGFLKLFGRFGK